MTAKDYITRGYRVSLQAQQAEIERAERDIMYSYICRVIYHTEDEETFISDFLNDINTASDDDWASSKGIAYRCFCSCVTLLLMQRKSIATRSGAKTPTITSAGDVNSYDILQQLSREGYMYLEKLKESSIAMIGDDVQALDFFRKQKVIDICGIYFKSNFFNL